MAPITKKANLTSKRTKSTSLSIPIGDDPDDLWIKTREACRSSIKTSLDKFASDSDQVVKTPEVLSTAYEENLYKNHMPDLVSYKQRFRKDVIAIKNKDTGFATDLLVGTFSIDAFSKLKPEELTSKRRRLEDKKLLEKELKNTITPNITESIKDIQSRSNIVSEKWGITESAAKVNDFENS